MNTHHLALKAVSRGPLAIILMISLALGAIGLIGSAPSKYICILGCILLAAVTAWFTLAASTRAPGIQGLGWKWMSLSIVVIIGLAIAYVFRDFWWTTDPPWVLFDALHGASMASCSLAITHLSATSIRQAYRRFLDAFALGGALTMIIWSTPFGEAILRQSILASMTKAVQLTLFFVVVIAACSTISPSRRSGPAFLISVGWLQNFTALIVLALLGTFHIRIHEGYVALPAMLCLTLTLAAAKHTWGQSTVQPQKPTSAFVANLAICVAVVTLGYQSREEIQHTTIVIGQIALMSIVVAARNSLSSWEIRDLLDKLGQRKEQLAYDANHDSLTSLVNRREFGRLVTAELERPNRPAVSIAFIDLDGFKAINDIHGHQAGDNVLVQVAKVLQESMPAGATCGRLSGDEFAVLFPATCHDHAANVSSFTKRVKEIRNAAGATVRLTASVGLATAEPGHNMTAEGLIHQADLAMYVIKHDGRDGYAVHSAAMASPFLDDRLLTPALRQAVDEQRIETHYQPVIDLRTHSVVGFEALSRWHHEGVRIKPSRFIGLAERGGVIEDLTWLVVTRACRQLNRWQSFDGGRSLTVGVNVPAPSLADPQLVAQILDIADKHGVAPVQLTLEVTESMPIRDITLANRTLQMARDAGIQVALDDFGTGCNSIAHLLQLPISKVKIDPTMVHGIELDSSRADVVAGMVTLATQRGLAVIAEGVENAKQLDLLQHMGVDCVQGFLLGRPNPPEHWNSLLGDCGSVFLASSACEDTVRSPRDVSARAISAE